MAVCLPVCLTSLLFLLLLEKLLFQPLFNHRPRFFLCWVSNTWTPDKWPSCLPFDNHESWKKRIKALWFARHWTLQRARLILQLKQQQERLSWQICRQYGEMFKVHVSPRCFPVITTQYLIFRASLQLQIHLLKMVYCSFQLTVSVS